MNIDLLNGQVGIFRIGEKVSMRDQQIEAMGYSVYIKSEQVAGISILFSEINRTRTERFRVNGKLHVVETKINNQIFQDKLLFKGKCLNIDKNTSSSDICEMFNKNCKPWDDGVEMGMEFVENDLRFEFNWQSLPDKTHVLEQLHIELYS